MSEISKRIRAYVNDQTVADHYGAWGALRPDQRRQIRELCDTCDRYEQAADSMQGTIVKFVVEIERLNAEMTRRQLPSYCQACTEEEAIKIGKEYGTQEVAREIFEEIEKISCRISESDANGNMRIVCYQLSSEKLAELKKKYTGGNNDNQD